LIQSAKKYIPLENKKGIKKLSTARHAITLDKHWKREYTGNTGEEDN
jgi:hypothetical protein